MKAQFSITYQTITPESAAEYDCAESGYEYEPGDIEFLSEALKEARDLGISQYSSNHPHLGSCWWSSVDPVRDNRTGEEKCYSLHVTGATPSTLKRIDRWLRTGKAFKEPSGNPG